MEFTCEVSMLGSLKSTVQNSTMPKISSSSLLDNQYTNRLYSSKNVFSFIWFKVIDFFPRRDKEDKYI
jgi:hypothetical protein